MAVGSWQSKRRANRASNTCSIGPSPQKTCRSSLWKREFPFLYPQGALLILAPRWNAGDASVIPSRFAFLSAACAVVLRRAMTLNGSDRNDDDPNGSSTGVDEPCGLQA